MASEAPSAPAPFVPADAAPAAAVKALSCPACGGTIELRAAGYTVTLICQYCSSVLDVANPDVAIIQRHNEESRRLAIPLGTRGTLKGIEWEAIGYLRRSEGGAYPWDEYLLFNPYHGYRWLVTDGRGWTLGTMLTTEPENAGVAPRIDGETYNPFFQGGHAQVDYVLGEFYWRVKVGEEVDTADFVRPGWMLSFEGSATERNWTLGELLDGKEAASAFGLSPPRPWRPGGAPPPAHQGSPYGGGGRRAGRGGLGALAALVAILILFGGSGAKQSYRLAVRTDGPGASATIGPVTLSRAWQAVTIRADAPGIDNAWIDLDYALVDRKTQQRYEAYGVAEHYSGSDSDGPWSEGSRDMTAKIAGVPAGDYDLVVDASGKTWGFGGSSSADVTIEVIPGGRFWSNFFLALILLFVPVIWMVYRHMRFEAARMGESDLGSSLDAFSDDDDDDDDEDDE